MTLTTYLKNVLELTKKGNSTTKNGLMTARDFLTHTYSTIKSDEFKSCLKERVNSKRTSKYAVATGLTVAAATYVALDFWYVQDVVYHMAGTIRDNIDELADAASKGTNSFVDYYGSNPELQSASNKLAAFGIAIKTIPAALCGMLAAMVGLGVGEAHNLYDGVRSYRAKKDLSVTE